MASKKANFFAEVERLKDKYRQLSSKQLLRILAVPYKSKELKACNVAANAILRERGLESTDTLLDFQPHEDRSQ